MGFVPMIKKCSKTKCFCSTARGEYRKAEVKSQKFTLSLVVRVSVSEGEGSKVKNQKAYFIGFSLISTGLFIYAKLYSYRCTEVKRLEKLNFSLVIQDIFAPLRVKEGLRRGSSNSHYEELTQNITYCWAAD
ncbi:hypothetical protein [Nostoc sp. CCY0012]|uniref:hypothetical protein n=1 Tax=Nostoc sp. CCY0012 TaxID=1056123 RepID=UPI0039C7015A